MTATLANAKIVKIGEHTFHLPFADAIPFTKEQRADLRASLEEAGCVEVPVVLWQQRNTAFVHWVVDGAHRIMFAAELGFSKDDVPTVMRGFADLEKAKDYCERVNCWRRHLPPSYLDNQRAIRIARVAAARAEGDSPRKIAEDEGISRAQVLRDLEEAAQVDPPGPPETQETPVSGNGTSQSQNVSTPSEPPKVTGRDGKTYPGRKPPVLCERCERLAPGVGVKDCPVCADLRKKGKGKKKGKKKSAPPEDDAPQDAFKNPLPKSCRDAYCDPWIQETLDFLGVMSAQLRERRLNDSMRKRAKRLPFFNEKDFVDGVNFIVQYLDELIDHIKINRPAGVCPACQGKKCSECRGSGLVPRDLYGELKKVAKEAAEAAT